MYQLDFKQARLRTEVEQTQDVCIKRVTINGKEIALLSQEKDSKTLIVTVLTKTERIQIGGPKSILYKEFELLYNLL